MKSKEERTVKKLRSVPPHSIESEQAVLASILIDQKAIDEVIGVIEVDDFYHPANGFIFAIFLELNRTNQPLDLVTLISKLKDTDSLDKAGGAAFLRDLIEIIPNAANVVGYATTVKEKATLRAMISAGSEITEMGYNTIEPIDELLDKSQSIVYNISNKRLKTDLSHVESLSVESFKLLEELYSRQGDDKDISGVPSGYADLDKLTNGFQNSDLIIIAGRPGMGKTSFGLNVLYNVALAGKTSAFFSLEMPNNQLINRIISSEGEISLSKLRTGNFNNEDWKKISECYAKLVKLNIYLDDSGSITVNQIRSKCRKLKQRDNLDIIFVDYLQLMGHDKSIVVREQQISEISRSLKSLAKELNIPVVAFAQVNRAVEHRTDNKPMLSDLRESGAIEQDADLIMFIYRDVIYNKDTLFPNTAEIHLAKHRNGATGVVYLQYDAQFTKFGKTPIDVDAYRALKESSKPAGKSKKSND